MSRKTTGLTALETRKQLLLLESELNRAQLITEWREVKKSAAHWTNQARAVGSLASSAAQLGTSLAGFFNGCSGHDKKSGDKKPSWIATIFTSARAGVSLWSAIRSHFR